MVIWWTTSKNFMKMLFFLIQPIRSLFSGEGSTSLVFCFLHSSSAVCCLLIPTQRLLELAYEKILYKTGVLSLGTMQLAISLTMPPSSELMIDWVS